MNILGLTFTALDFNIDSKYVNLDYSVRYTAFVEEYDINHRFYYESETVSSYGYNYRILYESKTDLDSVDYKIRYTAFEDLNYQDLDYKVRYEIEQPINYATMYKVRYESEGIEAYEIKKIFRVYYETEVVLDLGLDYRVRYTSEPPIELYKDYRIRYETSSYKPVQTSYTLLKREDGVIDLLVGVYKAKGIDNPYKIFNNLPYSLMYELREGDYRVKYLDDSTVLKGFDIDVRDKFISYEFSEYILIQDVEPSKALSLDVYGNKGCNLNDSTSYFFDLSDSKWTDLIHSIEDNNYITFNKTKITDLEFLNALSKTLAVEITKKGMVCCYGRKIIPTSANSCSP